MTVETEQRNNPLPIKVVTQETLGMSQMSMLGLEAAEARMRNSNNFLYEYLIKLSPIVPAIVAPFYNLIHLQYELDKGNIPYVTQETVKEFEDQIIDEGVNVAKENFRTLLIEDRQELLWNQIVNFLGAMGDINLAEAGIFALYDTYLLLRKQVERDTPKQK